MGFPSSQCHNVCFSEHLKELRKWKTTALQSSQSLRGQSRQGSQPKLAKAINQFRMGEREMNCCAFGWRNTLL
jgi:hypothetical protein